MPSQWHNPHFNTKLTFIEVLPRIALHPPQ